MARVKVKTTFNFKGIEKWEMQERAKLARLLKAVIPKQIKNGKSPVAPGRRFKSYSKSYKQAIQGKISFRTAKNGKVFPIKPGIDGELFKAFRKRRSPVNLTLSGQLLDSIFSKINKEGLVIGFKDKLADIHNRQGASKKKVVRRILPTQKGEKFSRVIQDDINVFLKRARTRLINILQRGK